LALALLAVAILSGSWLVVRGLDDPWPARAVLKTPGGTSLVEFSPDSRTCLTGGEGGITLWDIATGRKGETWAIEGNQPMLWGVFSPDGRTFAAIVGDPTNPLSIHLIDATTGRTRANFSTGFTNVCDIKFVDDGRTLRTFLGDFADLKEVVTWDASTGLKLSSRPFSAPTKQYGITTISDDGRTLVIASNASSNVELWDLDADRSLGTVINPRSTSVVSWGGVDLTSDGRSMAIARDDGTIEIWDLPGRTLRTTLKINQSGFLPSTLEFSPDGRTLAVEIVADPEASIVGQIREVIRAQLNAMPERDTKAMVLDIATGQRLAWTSTSGTPCFSPDGRTIATQEGEDSVKLRDAPGPSK
jgi:WD40 repeat protein